MDSICCNRILFLCDISISDPLRRKKGVLNYIIHTKISLSAVIHMSMIIWTLHGLFNQQLPIKCQTRTENTYKQSNLSIDACIGSSCSILLETSWHCLHDKRGCGHKGSTAIKGWQRIVSLSRRRNWGLLLRKLKMGTFLHKAGKRKNPSTWLCDMRKQFLTRKIVP